MSYTPSYGEMQTVFRCEGQLVRGYERGCPDFNRSMTVVEKWSGKIGRFVGERRAALRTSVQNIFFNGGRGDDCESACDDLAGGAAAATGVGVVALCVAVTRGIGLPTCMEQVGAVTLTATGASVASGNVVLNHLARSCKRNMCNK